MTLCSSTCECLQLVRSNLRSLEALATTRRHDERQYGTMLLDLNENAFGPNIAEHASSGQFNHQHVNQAKPLSMDSLNRYPASDQPDLKSLFCDFRNAQFHCKIQPTNICFSAGLDDLIDIVVRCFCKPECDYVLTCPPHYHMYSTCAAINDVPIININLDEKNQFRPRLAEIQQTFKLVNRIKVCFLCSPGNPTAYSIPTPDIITILEDPNWHGILVIDEAYIDFASSSTSAVTLLDRYPRLVVLQTMSKAFGLASIRLGFAIACENLTRVFNNVRRPYAVSGTSIAVAKSALMPSSLRLLDHKLRALQLQRTRLHQELPQIAGIGPIRGGPDTNFVLFEVLDAPGPDGRPCDVTAQRLSSALRDEANVLVRYKGDEYGCEGCVRVTVGTPAEMDVFLEQVALIMPKLLQRGARI